MLNGFLYVLMDLLNWYMDFSKLLHGVVKIDTWIALNFYRDLSKLILSCYADLSKLLHGFVKVVTRICQSYSMFFLLFVWPSLLKLLPRVQSYKAGQDEREDLNLNTSAILLICIWGQRKGAVLPARAEVCEQLVHNSVLLLGPQWMHRAELFISLAWKKPENCALFRIIFFNNSRFYILAQMPTILFYQQVNSPQRKSKSPRIWSKTVIVTVGQVLNFHNFSLCCLLWATTWGTTDAQLSLKERKKTASSVPQPTLIAFVGNLQTAKQYPSWILFGCLDNPTHLMTLQSLSIEMLYQLTVENGLRSLRFMLTLSYFVVDVFVCFFKVDVFTVP